MVLLREKTKFSPRSRTSNFRWVQGVLALPLAAQALPRREVKKVFFNAKTKIFKR